MSDPGSLAALFPEPLRPDPAVALRVDSVRTPDLPAGPVHGAQFVIEVAGPRSVAAQQARELLGPQWNGALGGPEIYAMSSADEAWRLMSTSDGAGSYDSLALAWDLIGVQGALSTASAKHLLQTAEAFASGVGRRAFPFPAPDEVDRQVKALQEAQRAFDVGVELIVQGASAIPEREIWRACAALGLDLAPDGVFVWRVPRWEEPLLYVAPLEEGAAYSLAGIQRGADYEAVSIGFNVPSSPDPFGCFEAAVHSAKTLAGRLGASAYDDEGHALNPASEARMREHLHAAVSALTSSGIEPGSRVALKLFAT